MSRVALVHYHLGAGGVSRVIAHQAAAAQRCGWDVALLAGEEGEIARWFGMERIARVPDLGYNDRSDEAGAIGLVNALRRGLRSLLGGPPDLWVIHNHALGKNLLLTRAVAVLAAEGERLLLQVHDFAEDGRAWNYRRMRDAFGDGDSGGWLPYPGGGRVHYAVLNGRDRAALVAAGVGEASAHLLPNPVGLGRGDDVGGEAIRSGEGAGRLFVYPTRAIRRKNIGELVYWSAFGDREDRYVTTMIPRDRDAREAHRAWERFVAARRLPVRFGVGEGGGSGLARLLGRASGAVTTSVCEGFGLAFLEPWTAGCAVYGRDLPWLTGEFRRGGIELGGVYERLEIPLGAVDAGALRVRLEEALAAWERGYGVALPGDYGERVWARAVVDGRVDFGFLDEPMQVRALDRLLDDGGLRADLAPLPWVREIAPEIIEANRERIGRGYGPTAYATRFGDVLARVAAGGGDDLGDGAIDARALLRAFLDPATYSLLRA